ncbi:MAG: hypothetical protein JXD22_11630 [Sedimentisphaerales bacterium]|nr:hypothetical protein [Sedimentisphaerales bacterium]
MGYQIRTMNNYDFFEVASAMQKAIRRGDGRLASYWALELYDSKFEAYVWRRLHIISAEDVWGCITFEIEALYNAWKLLRQQDKKAKPFCGAGRLFAVKAAMLLAMAKKSRDADNMINLVFNPKKISDADLERDLAISRQNREDIPDYAFDCHTRIGKQAGKTKDEFMVEEHDALYPREKGLFDQDVEDLRKKNQRKKG